MNIEKLRTRVGTHDLKRISRQWWTFNEPSVNHGTMPIQIHIGKSRKVPFIVRLDGQVDATTAVQVGSSQPVSLQVELFDFRTLKVTAVALTALASAVVKTFPGTASEHNFPLDFTVVSQPPPVATVEFGEPGEEEDA